jgi:hypothetical protein
MTRTNMRGIAPLKNGINVDYLQYVRIKLFRMARKPLYDQNNNFLIATNLR